MPGAITFKRYSFATEISELALACRALWGGVRFMKGRKILFIFILYFVQQYFVVWFDTIINI